MVDNIRIAPAINALYLLACLILCASRFPLVGAVALHAHPPRALNSLYYDAALASDTPSVIFKRAEQHDPFFIVSAILIPVLVLLSGAFAGLTLGYMSLDETQLKVLSVSGSPKQKEYARKIAPLRKNGHLLLITLLISNMIVNETLPIISDQVLGGGVQAVVVSTVLIIIFAEIIPQSVCSRYGLVIGAKMAPFVRVLVWALIIVSWPVAKLLEYVLGPHHGIIYRRGELKELINMHAALGEHGGDLKTDTVTIVGGALDLQEKVVADAMTPIDKAFMLDIDSRLDYETLTNVVRSGHSRIPVYEKTDVDGTKVTRILGVLLVKQCVLLDPEDATPLREIPLNALPTVPFDEPLLGILDRFQEGRSHMAIVSRIPRRTKERSLMDESMNEIKESMTRRFLRRFGGGDSSEEDEDDETKRNSRARRNGDVEMGHEDDDRERSRTPKGPKEQTMPADAVLDPGRANAFFDSLEGAPLGLITLEDVLEELIGEEILDEFDLTGAQALPASTYVPPEAQRAVDAAIARTKANAAKAQARISAVVKPVVQVSRPIGAMLPKGMRALKFGVERSRSAPGRTREGSPTGEHVNGDQPSLDGKNELGLPVEDGSQLDMRGKPASLPVDAYIISDDGLVTSTAPPSAMDRLSAPASPVAVPTIVFQTPESDEKGSPKASTPRPQTASSLPPHVSAQTLAPEARRSSPAPSLLNEAILLERGRRRAAAHAISGVSTRAPGTPEAGSTVAFAGNGAPVPNAKDLEEKLAGVGGVRAKGARYKSSPLAPWEKGGSAPTAAAEKEG